MKIKHAKPAATFERELRNLLEAVDRYALCACSESPCPLMVSVEKAEHALPPMPAQEMVVAK